MAVLAKACTLNLAHPSSRKHPMTYDTLILHYDFLLAELQRVLSTRGKWTAMPTLLDQLHRLREQMQLAAVPQASRA
jgi:hypothetical protein